MGLLARFGLAGLANTIVGGAVIMMLDLGLKVPSWLAALCGYAVGIVLGFVLNRGFVFRTGGGRDVALRYLAAVGIGLAVNQMILRAALAVLGREEVMRMAAQLIGMGCYTVLTFVLCRYWVFARAANASTAGQSASNT